SPPSQPLVMPRYGASFNQIKPSLVILRYGASVSQIKPFSSIVIPHYGAPVDIHSLQSIFPNNLSGSLLNSQSSYRYPFKISLQVNCTFIIDMNVVYSWSNLLNHLLK